MYSIETLIPIIQNELSHNYQEKQPSGLYQPIDYVLSEGGKRIRPILCLMACNLFTDDIEIAVKPAIGLEIFHNFTLLHDDIMDHADVRRGKATVHKKWNENTAILSGDVMMIEAYEHFMQLSPILLSQVLPIFNRTAREVCEGQQYDMDFEQALDITEAEYLKMIRLKTAVLLAGALKIGAIIGGASLNNAQKIYDFGIAMGIAFQLQDDYLDTFGNKETFGKKIGGDIVENKKTILLIKALEIEKNALIPLLSDKNEQRKINSITAVYKKSKIDIYTQNKALNYYKEAIEIIESISIPSEKKVHLLQFLNQLKKRMF